MIPHAKELPKVKAPDTAQIALDQWLNNQGPIITKTLLNRKAGETRWYFPCRHEQYRDGQVKIAAYMHELGYVIQWQSAREGGYANTSYGTQVNIPARQEGFEIRAFSW